MTVFLPAPDRLRSGLVVLDADLEEEYLGPPMNVGNSEKIEGPGIAEIKPHTRKKITEAHDQLTTQRRKGRGRYKEVLLITYKPNGATTPVGTRVDVWAVRHIPDIPKRRDPRFPDGKHTTPSDYLAAAWWSLGEALVPPTISVNLADLSVFGAAAELPIRTHFGQFLEKPPHLRVKAVTTPHSKSPSDSGPDVRWKEIAEMYAELARTTNDEFLAALANELATPA